LKVLEAEFITSVVAGNKLPLKNVPIVALIGRSNVGKSSLINALVKRRIARSGSTPGITRLVNVYRVRLSTNLIGTRTIMIVDLPGYGYARGGHKARKIFDELVQDFFKMASSSHTQRFTPNKNLFHTGVILTVDMRHPGLKSDRLAQAWMVDNKLPFLVAATKQDQLSKTMKHRVQQDHESALEHPVIPVSSKTGEGLDKLWSSVFKLISDYLI